MANHPRKQVRVKFKVEKWQKEFSEFQAARGSFNQPNEFLQFIFMAELAHHIPEEISKPHIGEIDRLTLAEYAKRVLELPEFPYSKNPKRLVIMPLIVEQWQLDFSKQMVTADWMPDTDFLQGVLNTATMKRIPEEARPPFSEEEKARIKEHLAREDVDPETPF